MTFAQFIFEERELDQVLAKMSEEDLTTELGSFIILS